MSYRTIRAHLGSTQDSPFLEFRIPSDRPGTAAALFDANGFGGKDFSAVIALLRGRLGDLH